MASSSSPKVSSMIQMRCEFTHNDWGKIGADSLVWKLTRRLYGANMLAPNTAYAELWMGSHVLHPSVDYKSGHSLGSIIRSNPNLLSPSICNRFNGQMPFLFKVLSIKSAICIQAHPGEHLARQLHLHNPVVYPDSNHKPEMIVALTPFEALCGFRPFHEISLFLLHVPPLRRLIGACVHECIALSSQDKGNSLQKNIALKRTWESLLRSPHEKIVSCSQELKSWLANSGEDLLDELSTLKNVILRLNEQHPDDIGLFAIFFLNYISLAPGEALFVPPNELHSYLSGDAIECMASSANVVRGGFTKKQKDLDTLIAMASYTYCSPLSPKILLQNPYVAFTTGAVSSVLYQAPAEEFDVVKTDLVSQGAQIRFSQIDGPSIFICIWGSGEIETENGMEDIGQGSIFFIGASNEVTIRNTASESLTIFQALCDSKTFQGDISEF